MPDTHMPRINIISLNPFHGDKCTSGPVSIQTKSLALASSQSWLPLLRQRIPIGWRLLHERKRLRFLRFSFMQRTKRKRLRLNGNRASGSTELLKDNN